MGRWTLWLSVLAVLAGFGAAIAFAGAGPLPANGVTVYYQGPGGATARQDDKWLPLDPAHNPRSLWVTEPTFIRGPALVSMNGAYICLAPNEVVQVSWNPAVGAWGLSGWCGCGGGDGLIYAGGDENNFPPKDTPEVSGFDPFDVPRTAPPLPPRLPPQPK
jgi:hypothetical protein